MAKLEPKLDAESVDARPRLAVCDVRLWTEATAGLAAQPNVT
jgi:hypothetical protein